MIDFNINPYWFIASKSTMLKALNFTYNEHHKMKIQIDHIFGKLACSKLVPAQPQPVPPIYHYKIFNVIYIISYFFHEHNRPLLISQKKLLFMIFLHIPCFMNDIILNPDFHLITCSKLGPDNITLFSWTQPTTSDFRRSFCSWYFFISHVLWIKSY